MGFGFPIIPFWLIPNFYEALMGGYLSIFGPQPEHLIESPSSLRHHREAF